MSDTQNDTLDDAVDFCREFDDQEDDERGRITKDGVLLGTANIDHRPALRVITKRHGKVVVVADGV